MYKYIMVYVGTKVYVLGITASSVLNHFAGHAKYTAH